MEAFNASEFGYCPLAWMLHCRKLNSRVNKLPERTFRIACQDYHSVKIVRIRGYSGPYFPGFGLNTERYSVSLRIQSECGKILTRITPNTDTF